MKHSDYWRGRFEALNESLLRQGIDCYDDIEREYRQAMQRIEKDITVWYQRLAVNNDVSFAAAKKLLTANELEEFRWSVEKYIKRGKENAVNQRWIKQLENASAKVHISRLEAIKLQMQQHLEVLYGNQLDGMDKAMRKLYQTGYYRTAYEVQRGIGVGFDFASIDETRLQKILAKPWAADSKIFSDRIWQSKAQLINALHTELTQATIRGDPPERPVRAIAKKMNTSLSNAGRLVMTESAFFAAASQRDCFDELGVERYEIIATLDLKTSPICREMDGKVFKQSDYKPGVTAPPLHCWCRSCTAPYFEDNPGVRAARGEDGKTHHVPADMHYEDWYKVYVDKTVKSDEWRKSRENATIELRESIKKKHNSILREETHKQEFDEIIATKSEQVLRLYDKLSSHFSKSEYYLPRSGAYYPMQRKIRMDMNNNAWEKRVGVNRTGAWNTKFHEEFHQLDHLLEATGFAGSNNGVNIRGAFTDIRTQKGAEMGDAIMKDVINVINRAIDENPATDGLKRTKVKSLGRISSDAKKALYVYLHRHYDTPAKRAQIAMFTDAMGLCTQDRLSPFKWGFWGHDSGYNKSRGISGATSETWANYGAVVMQEHEPTMELLRELMPETFKVYDRVFGEVLEFAAKHELEYQP